MQRTTRILRGVVLAGALAIAVAAMPSATQADLNGQAQSLQQGVDSDNGQLQVYQGKLSDLRARLNGLQASLDAQRQLLVRVQGQLLAARARLALLRRELVVDRRRLAAQLVSQYESPPPDMVDVVVESHGFADLLERVDQMRRLAAANVRVITGVARDRRLVAAQARRLAVAEAHQRRVTAAVLVERDQVARIQYSLLARERTTAADRDRKQARLHRIQHKLAILQAQAAAAQQGADATVSGGVGFTGGGFVPHGGSYGFFPAPGTNYSVGNEPEIAARLDALGKALQLHLIGLSGYRSPQHSVEVGGFADDPHTRGEASDTPGVEGVPEATLLRFGLTRPFGGAAEADHIQLA